MSTSRAKQISQKRKSKTKSSGNGAKLDSSKNKKMTKGSKNIWFNKSGKKGKK